MNQLIRKLSLSMLIIMLVLMISDIFSTQPVHAEPSLPIVSEEGIYSIDVYPLRHELIVYAQGNRFKTYRVAVGNLSTPTPVGEFKVIYKGSNWGPSFGPRWLGLNVPWGIYGIHGTNKPQSIGQHKSHGCIRMQNLDVMELFDFIPVGTKVTIHGHVLGDPSHDPRALAEGDVGGDVQLIQTRLKSAGYFKGTCNGKFRYDTTVALKQFQKDHGLPVNGVVSITIYYELGLYE
ncbi:putative L,D-transpeptidase YkuD [compost metagenome]